MSDPSKDAEPLFRFEDLLRVTVPGFPGQETWKIVRHRSPNDRVTPNLTDLFHLDREAFHYYQSDQTADIFGGLTGVFSCLGIPPRHALFIGAYRVRSGFEIRPPSLDEVPRVLRAMYARVQEEHGRLFRYELEPDPRFDRLAKRVVVDWGLSMRSWHQRKLDKPVVELRDPAVLEPCPRYRDIDVRLDKLSFIVNHANANPTWRERLLSVGGIYLLTNRETGRLYVGQAGGKDGFWGRWLAYAAGSTGNVEVDAAIRSGEIQPQSTYMSILEVVPRSALTRSELTERESLWKTRLCSRKAGYNRN